MPQSSAIVGDRLKFGLVCGSHHVVRHTPTPIEYYALCTVLYTTPQPHGCHEPPGAFSNCQPAGQHGSISFSGPLLLRPCLCLGHLHLGLGLHPHCWYILVLAYTPAYSITNDHSLRTATHRSHDQQPSLRQPLTPPRFVTISNDTRWYSGSW
jgi:hypothetical protein